MDIKLKVANRIKELRKKNKITQEELARLSGIDRTFVSHVERGSRNVSIETIEALVYGLGVSLKSFFSSKEFSK